MNSDFETEGTWRIMGGGLVYEYGRLPVYEPKETDVRFNFGPHYNWGMPWHIRENFLQNHKIIKLIEIIEVFREPYNDADRSFKGRQFLIAQFDNVVDAIMFKLSI